MEAGVWDLRWLLWNCFGAGLIPNHIFSVDEFIGKIVRLLQAV
jgi:hypothetical protein